MCYKEYMEAMESELKKVENLLPENTGWEQSSGGIGKILPHLVSGRNILVGINGRRI